jgi:DNA-binding phage protein
MDFKNVLPEALLRDVERYIAENYVDLCAFAACEPMPVYASKASSLEDILKQEDAGFTETLLRRIDESGRKDAEVYKKAGLTKQHFSKIRNNPHYKPTKPTALALAVALELDLDGTKDLIGRAGYALTNSSKFDLIVRYFIEQGNYDVVEINMVLYKFDQPLLCS